VTVSNYFKIAHHGHTSPDDFFPFDGDDRESHDTALLAAEKARGSRNSGRLVAWRRPKYGAYEGGLVGEPATLPVLPVNIWSEPRKDLPS
jgi:hypothetical protein